MIARLLVLLFLLPFAAVSQNQEIATFLTYNLLNYRNETSFCTSSNNSSLAKEGYLKTIFGYTQPDLIACNEIGANPSNAVKILDRCLNVDGETKYAMAPYAATSGSNLTNAFFYNGEMFALKNSDVVDKEIGGDDIVRLINVYYLYYLDANLPLNSDTTFLTVFVAHFKAGNSSSDAAERDEATQSVMKYVDDEGITGNYIISGDFNTYTSSEDAIQNLINPTNSMLKFVDPINQMGNWNNNSSYAAVHTQSTHHTSNGCASGGGLDDRFDFILVSQSIKDDSDHMDYVNNSYKAVANDGNHFNQSINNPANSSVPAAVLDAIYEMSDHLPVLMDMVITEAQPNGIVNVTRTNFDIRIVNPAHGFIRGSIVGVTDEYELKVFTISGELLAYEQVQSGNEFKIPLASKGLFFVEITDSSGSRAVIKVVGN